MKDDILHFAVEAAKKLPKLPTPGWVDPTTGFMTMFQAWQGYQQTRQGEKTKRAAIRANAEIQIARFKEQAQLVRDYLQMIFAERKENFARSFDLLEAGLAKGDDRQVEVALSMIVTLVKESPIRQAADVVRAIKERREGEIIDL